MMMFNICQIGQVYHLCVLDSLTGCILKGIPFGDEEGDIISGVLSDNYWSALLSHHGLIVGGRSIEEATYRAYFFERAAKMQLDALSAVGGDIQRLKKTNVELSEKARDWRISEGPVKAHFNGWAQIVLKEDPPF